MRRAFVEIISELAKRDNRILLLTGDLGYTVLEPFAEKFPKQFFNVGVAEQNMVGLATGLAEAGFIPFIYSIGTFVTLRPYEFIRNGPILHQLPVRIVGIGDGFDYASAGITHFNLEDVGIMRIQPGIAVIVPADYEQARTAILETWDLPGPIYYRLGKDESIVTPGLKGRFELGRIQIIREGKDLLFVSMGSVTSEVVAAAEMLATQGITSTVVVISSFNPAPIDDLAGILLRFRIVLTVEEHYVTGGIGSWVCEVVAERCLECRVIRCGVKKVRSEIIGSQKYLRQLHQLSRESLVESALKALSQVQK